MSIDPFSAIAAGVNTTIKILEVSFQLKAVGEQTADLLRTTEHVDRNLNEARRLRRLKTSLLSADDRNWMDRQINDCEAALQEVQRLIEPARVDSATAHFINPKTKTLWVLRDSPKVRDKHNRLATCHQTLLGIIGVLHARDVVVVAPLPSVEGRAEDPPPYTKDMEAMFNWRSQRRKQKSSSDLRAAGSRPSSMSDPTTPIPCMPEVVVPSDRGRRPVSLAEPGHDMSAQAAPSVYYEGYDGLQVYDPSDECQLSRDAWSPISFTCNEAAASPLMAPQAPPIPPKILDGSSQGSTASLTPNLTDMLAEKPRTFARTKGREWLACYAARSDLGHSHGDSKRFD